MDPKITQSTNPGELSAGLAKQISSPVFGQRLLECIHIKVLNETFRHYGSTVKVKGHGELAIVVHLEDDEHPDWEEAVKKAEVVWPIVLKREPRIRRSAIPAVRHLLKRYRYAWKGTDAALLAQMKLNQVMFAGDSFIQLSYSGGKAFHGLDLNVHLGPRFGVRNVQFDG